MKKIFLAISAFAMIASVVLISYAHSGRTDGAGGHTDHSTGEYHYHHGCPAHDHYDMDGDGDIDCPYEYDNRTDHGSLNSNSTEVDLDIDIPQIPTFDFDSFTVPTYDNYIIQPEKYEKESTSDDLSPVVSIVMGVLVVGIWIAPIFFKRK